MPRGKPAQKKRPRQQGTGAVYWNKAKGRYQAAVQMNPNDEGKRVRKVYTTGIAGKTDEAKDDCLRWLEQAKVALLQGTLTPPSKETIQAFLEDWCATKAALLWGVRQREDVPRRLKLYVYPVIGAIKLNTVDASHVVRVLARMAVTISRKTKRPLSKRTMLHVYKILHSALGDRVQWDDVQTPTIKRTPYDMPHEDTISLLIQQALGEPYGLVFVVMAVAGLRTGEVLGLRRADLDFERNTIRVQEAIITRGQSRGEAKEAKSDAGHRTISVPVEVMQALRAYCDQRAALQLKAGRVFCTDRGRTPNINVLYRAWRNLLERCGIEYFRPYDLRHFAASFWLDQGATLAQVAAALGHSAQTTTAGVYSHVIRRPEGRIAQISGRLLKLEPVTVDEVNRG